MKAKAAEDVTKTAANLDNALADGLGPPVQPADDVCGIGLTGVADVPAIETVETLKQIAFQPPKRPAGPHHG